MCSLSCPSGHFGANCAPCKCENGAGCDPLTGECVCTTGKKREKEDEE